MEREPGRFQPVTAIMGDRPRIGRNPRSPAKPRLPGHYPGGDVRCLYHSTRGPRDVIKRTSPVRSGRKLLRSGREQSVVRLQGVSIGRGYLAWKLHRWRLELHQASIMLCGSIAS